MRRKVLTEITGDPDKDFTWSDDRWGPWRCSCCNFMQPSQARGYRVVSSAHFFKTDGYSRLAYTSSQADRKETWCLSCILETKNRRDNFTIPQPR